MTGAVKTILLVEDVEDNRGIVRQIVGRIRAGLLERYLQGGKA